MKFIIPVILVVLFNLPCNSQAIDTVRIFDYLTFLENWQIKIKSNNTFTFTSNILFGIDTLMVTGYCKTGDSSIQFIADTSTVSNRNSMGDELKQFSNIAFIAQGHVFKRHAGFFVPNNMIYSPEDSARIPPGIYARYSRGDGFGSDIIELRKDGSYKFTDHSCEMNFYEEGKWVEKNNIISFFPPKKGRAMLTHVTDNNQLYADEGFLVGKKTIKSTTKTN